MADIMSDSGEDDLTFVNKTEVKEENNKNNLSEIERLEAGVIVKPKIQKNQNNKSFSSSMQKKLDFDKHFLSFKNIVDDK